MGKGHKRPQLFPEEGLSHFQNKKPKLPEPQWAPKNFNHDKESCIGQNFDFDKSYPVQKIASSKVPRHVDHHIGNRKQSRSYNRDHMRKPFKVPHEVSVRANGQLDKDTEAALSSSNISSAIPAAAPKKSTSFASTFPPYKGTPETLPPLPSLPEETAKIVFTHQHTLHGFRTDKIKMSYDRLELLGDAYIEVMATRLIYPRFPDFSSGRLSQQREMLVKNETLAEYAFAYGFEKRLKLPDPPKGEEVKKQSKPWTKIMGDVVEAYVAAIILSNPDDGFQVAENWLHSLWEVKLAAIDAEETVAVDMNAKQKLARKIVSSGIRLDYRDDAPQKMIKEQGKIWYHVGVYLTGWGCQNEKLGSGKGLNKQEAGQKAAADAFGRAFTGKLEAMKKEHDQKVKEERTREAREEEQWEAEKVGTAGGGRCSVSLKHESGSSSKSTDEENSTVDHTSSSDTKLP